MGCPTTSQTTNPTYWLPATPLPGAEPSATTPPARAGSSPTPWCNRRPACRSSSPAPPTATTTSSTSPPRSPPPGRTARTPAPRTHGRIVLDAIEAVLEGRANQDCQRIVIADTLLIKYPVADLLMLRDRYVVIVRKEEDRAKIASGRRTGRRILTRFRAANQSPFTARGQS